MPHPRRRRSLKNNLFYFGLHAHVQGNVHTITGRLLCHKTFFYEVVEFVPEISPVFLWKPAFPHLIIGSMLPAPEVLSRHFVKNPPFYVNGRKFHKLK